MLFDLIMRLVIIGVRVRATKPENNTQNAKVHANSMKSLQRKPSMRPIGRNTEATVIVIATIAKPISLEASNAACIGVLPSS